MLFHATRPTEPLRHALQGAIAEHSAETLSLLVGQHGPDLVARALSTFTERAREDALSMLSLARRRAVTRHLPWRLRRQPGVSRLMRGGRDPGAGDWVPLQGLLTWGPER